MAIKLFTLNVDGNIEINKVEILAYEPFKKILSRDRGSVGDAQGRLKEQAFKEFLYIYHYCDIKSEGVRKGHSDERRHEEALVKIGLDENWKPDEVVVEAMEMYKKEQSVIASEMIFDILELFQANGKVVKIAKKTINGLIARKTLNKDELIEILNMNQVVFNFAKEIPSLTKDLHDVLKGANLDEEGAVHILRGSKETVPDSMNPDKALG